VPDVYWKVVRSLHPVVDFHGPDSDAAKEAKQILQDVIHIIKKAYVLAYKGRVSSMIHDPRNSTFMDMTKQVSLGGKTSVFYLERKQFKSQPGFFLSWCFLW
jgi:hypothetical protein